MLAIQVWLRYQLKIWKINQSTYNFPAMINDLWICSFQVLFIQICTMDQNQPSQSLGGEQPPSQEGIPQKQALSMIFDGQDDVIQEVKHVPILVITDDQPEKEGPIQICLQDSIKLLIEVDQNKPEISQRPSQHTIQQESFTNGLNVPQLAEEQAEKTQPVPPNKEFNFDEELTTILQKFSIDDQESISEAIALFKDNNLQQLITLPAKKFRKQFQQQINIFYAKVASKMVKKEKTIQQILSQSTIPRQYHQSYAKQLIQGDFKFLLSVPNQERRKILKAIDKMYQINQQSMELHLRIALTSHLSDQQIEDVLDLMKQRRYYRDRVPEVVIDIIQNIQKAYTTQLTLKFDRNQTKRITVNQLLLSQKQSILEQVIAKSTGKDMEEIKVFMKQQIVDLNMIQLKTRHKYTLELRQMKRYTCKYKQKQRKIKLMPQMSINYNVNLIAAAFQQQKELNLDESDTNAEFLTLKFMVNGKVLEADNYQQTLISFQEKEGPITTIFIQITLKIILYYGDMQETVKLSSDNQVKDLRKVINDKYVPYNSQQLILIIGSDPNNKQDLDEQKDNKLICQLSQKRTIVFELINKRNCQFYGFHDNISLTFQNFSEFFMEDEESTKKLINYCSFARNNDEEHRFILHFFSYMFSGIKKRFPITTFIDKFKTLILKLKFQSIWTPLRQNETIKVNQAFVVCYLLKNADSRLRIELMNLLRQNVPIPLYFKNFQDISKATQSSSLQLNEELLWILKEGYTIVSLGLHNQGKVDIQKGKSSLINEIFVTNFQESQNKHAIIKGLPYIAVRVFQDLIPIHVIDIPHDTGPSTSRQILQNSNMIILHSWKNDKQTQKELLKLKKQFKIPIICLIRDSKQMNILKDLRENHNLNDLKENYFAQEKPQKIINLSRKETYKSELNLLKDQIYKFIKIKMENDNNFSKFFQFYRLNQSYRQFSKILSSLEKQMQNNSSMTPIRDQLQLIRRENIKEYEQAKNERKSKLKDKLNSEIQQIVIYLAKEQVKHKKSLLVNYLRQSLKAYQNSLNIKYIKIYSLRDEFEIIRSLANDIEKKERIQQLNQGLTQLIKLYPENIIGQTDDFISSVITKMIDQFENRMKPNIFSVQLFWRELNYLVSIDQKVTVGNLPLLNVLRELKEVEINSNLPFEIIDGDMLEMPRKLMMKLFENKEERAIVITILGPQSSGKSTLLNFLFGCDFATSEGRCTRGVYGTYFRFAENKGQFNNLTNCEGIFVIDTEGLFSITNDRDRDYEDRKNFDSKLVLFCLAVSDFVIINVRGNLEKNTQRIIRLCHQRLEDLNRQKHRQPEIIVTLNIKTGLNKQESEIQFKEIKKTINFDISKSLPLAYQIKNYSSEEINLFDSNQKLTKKYPLQDFYKETSNLMNQILKKIIKKKEVLKLCDIIQKFERIWSMVVTFPDLSKSVTKQYRQLEKSIKEWKDRQQQEQRDELQKMFEGFTRNKITENNIIEYIELNQKKLLNLYDANFKEKGSDQQQIKFLIRQQRARIISKFSATISNIKYELQNIKLKKQIKISKVQGDYMLKEKAKEVYNSNIFLSEEQLKAEFDKVFKQQLDKIQLTTDLGKQVVREFQTIYDNYLFLIREQTGSEKGLPQEKSWIGNETCSIQDMLSLIRERIIQPNQKNYEDVLIHTNKIHTNVLRGGKTDASLEYFSMKDYFKTQTITQFYVIDKYKINQTLNYRVLQQSYKRCFNEAKKEIDNTSFLKIVWDDINRSLQLINLRFTKFDQFKDLFEAYEGKKYTFTFLEKKKQIKYEFLKGQNNLHYIIEQYQCSTHNYRCQCRQNKTYHRRQLVDHQKHKFSRFLKQYIQKYPPKTCLCQYQQEPASHLLPRFYQHINWEAILREAQQKGIYQVKMARVNKTMTQLVNNDLKLINLKIKNQVSWHNYFQHIQSSFIYFEQAGQIKLAPNSDQIQSIIQKIQFISPKQFKKFLKVYQKQEETQYNYLHVFSITNTKLQPIIKNGYFKSYLTNNINLTIKQLKRPQFKQFIFDELKNNGKQSLRKFFFNVFEIVEATLKQWRKLEKKTYIQIYNKVNQEVCKFNNDLNQISCNLSEKYVGYIHLAVVYMIWKLVIDQKIQEKRQIYEQKKKDYENQWNMFKARTSKDEDSNVEGDVRQFCKEFCSLINQIISKKKLQEIDLESKRFHKQQSRQKIQTLIDIQIFKKETQAGTILDYLQNPQRFIIKKYEACYEESWENIKTKFSMQRAGHNIVRQFYDIMKVFLDILRANDIDQNKKNFSDFFEIIDKAIRGEISKQSSFQFRSYEAITQANYEHDGKRVLFQYFIDTLICEDPSKPRKCANIDVKPLFSLNIVTQTSAALRGLLIELRNIKYLSLTNFIKFVMKLTAPEIMQQLNEKIASMNQLSQIQRLKFINNIKTVVCGQKCPCCGRICGLQNQHQFHKCLYGHQMRGLNGTYIQRQNKTREASVIRCEQLCQTDLIKYNGEHYLWIQFKDYWKNKNPGGWLFDDATLSNNTNQLRFENAWTIAGPIYCQKENLIYLPFNKSEAQKIEAKPDPVHYIFALDQSGSMKEYNRWSNLLISFKETIEKIKKKNALINNIKVSLMKFNQKVANICENLPPNDITICLACQGGGTNFDPAFEMAAKIANNYIEKATVVFIFMTDGDASYPTNGIKQLRKLQLKYPNKLKYAGIQFSSNAKVMKTICQQLKGTTGVAYNVEQLTDLLMKSIEVITFKQKS